MWQLATRRFAFNISGDDNVAIGNNALNGTSSTNRNTVIGSGALEAPLSPGAGLNTVVGAFAAARFALGSDNTLIGADADVGQDGATNCVALRKFCAMHREQPGKTW